MNRDECDLIFDRALSSQSEGEFCFHISPLLDFYKVISVGIGRGNIAWRARKAKDRPWGNLFDLDYPPAELARAGRLNDKGSSCFYVSRSVETALNEIEACEGDLVQVAGFRVLTEQTLQLILIGEYSNVVKRGYVQFAGIDPGGTLQKLVNNHSREDALTLIYIDRFLASVLADPNARESGYRFSRALGAALHLKIRSADGIAFPSVRDPGGYNYAVLPGPSDRIFHNVACLLVRVGRNRRFSFTDHETLNSATYIDDDLNFVWPEEYAAGTINLYGMTKEEYEYGRSGRPGADSLDGLLSIYAPKVR